MIRKLIQIANSTRVIIPKAILDKFGFKSGTEVHREEDTAMKTLPITKKGKVTKSFSITPDFLSLLDKVNKNYRATLKELANK